MNKKKEKKRGKEPMKKIIEKRKDRWKKEEETRGRKEKGKTKR